MLCFFYMNCHVCEFDMVLLATAYDRVLCPLCLSDTGHRNPMVLRPAAPSDKPEGHDERTWT